MLLLGKAREEAGQGGAALLERGPPAQGPGGLAQKDGPPRAGLGGAPGKAASGRRGKASGRRLGRGVQLGPGMTTSHISNIIIR